MEAREAASNDYALRYGVKPAVEGQQATPANQTAGGLPTITGTAQVGETLTAGTSDIAGATRSTYTLTADDLADTIKVRVSFTDDDRYSETLTSNAIGAVMQTPNQGASLWM